MTIQFNCPTCNKTLKAPDDKAGATVSCPGCKTTLHVPYPQAEESELNQTTFSQEWFYTKDGQRVGPVSLEELQTLAASGGLQPSDMVWKQGMAQWTPAVSVSELGTSLMPPPLPKVVPASPPPLSTGRRMGEDSTRVLAKSPISERVADDGASSASSKRLDGETRVLQSTSRFDRLRQKHPSLAHWSDKAFIASGAGILLCFFVCCGGFVTFVAKQDDESAKKELREANELWAKDRKADAAGKYKQVIEKHWHTSSVKSESSTILQRLIEFEAEQGNTSSARSLIEKAEQNKIALSLDSPKAKEIMTQFQRERQEQAEFAQSKKKERDNAATSKKNQQEDAATAKKGPKEDVASADKKTGDEQKSEAYKKQEEQLANAKREFQERLRKTQLADAQITLMASAVVAQFPPGLNPGAAAGWGITTPEGFNHLMQEAAATIGADKDAETKHLLVIQPSSRKEGTSDGKRMVTVFYGTKVSAGFIQNSFGTLVVLMVKIDNQKYTPFGVK